MSDDERYGEAQVLARRYPDNLCVQYLREHDEYLIDYDGDCVDLAGKVIAWLDEHGIYASLTYIEPRPRDHFLLFRRGWCWSYHAVVLVNAVFHDAWHPAPLVWDRYVRLHLPDQRIAVDFSADAD